MSHRVDGVMDSVKPAAPISATGRRPPAEATRL